MKRLLLIASISIYAGPPHVVEYRAQVATADRQRYSVDIEMTISGDSWRKPSWTLEHSEALIGCRIDGADCQIESSGVLDRLRSLSPVAPGSICKLHYAIDASQRGVRIPLAVPEIPSAGAPDSIRITVATPGGFEIAGDIFPKLEQRNPNLYEVDLASVPSHVEFELTRPDEVSFRQRWLTPAALSDFAVLALLALGTITRAAMRRKRRDGVA
jgi:hypothetical protein